MRVSDIMMQQPACCTPQCTAQIAASVMREMRVGFLPVLEKFSRKLVGVVTDHDLCLMVLAEARQADRVAVRECMTPDPVYCRPNDDIRTALDLMKRNRLRRLPVLNENGGLEGVVSLDDVIAQADLDAADIKSAANRICYQRGSPAGHETQERVTVVLRCDQH